ASAGSRGAPESHRVDRQVRHAEPATKRVYAADAAVGDGRIALRRRRDRGQGGQDQGPADGLGPSSQGTPQSSARSSGGVRPRGSCLQAKGVGTGGGTGQGGGRERRRRTSRPRAPARGRVGAQAQPLQGS